MAAVGVISAQPLFSHTTTSGSPRAAANTRASWTEPWFIAPSPIELRTTPPSPLRWVAMATPAPIGTPAPTIEFSPSMPQRGAKKCGEPPRPPLMPSAFWQSSPSRASSGTPQAIAQPWPR